MRLINKLAGRTIPILSDDFALGLEGRQPLRSADFALQQTREESLPGGRRLVFHLAARSQPSNWTSSTKCTTPISFSACCQGFARKAVVATRGQRVANGRRRARRRIRVMESRYF